MIRKFIQGKIIEQLPSFSVLKQLGGNIFFERPIDHVLAGFYIDAGSSFTYFGFVCVPLCRRLQFVGPAFGGRLSGDSAGVPGGLRDKEIAVAFVDAIEPYRAFVDSLKDTMRFIDFAGSHEALANENLRLGYAEMLLIENRIEEAFIQFEILLRENPECSDASYIFQKAKFELQAAQEFLIDRENENKRRFGIY